MSNQTHIHHAAWDENRLAWLLLTWFEGFGSRTFFKLHRRYDGQGQRAAAAHQSILQEIGVKPAIIEKYIAYRKKTDARKLAEKLECEGIQFLRHDDAGYPPLLREIPDPPYALFVRGATDMTNTNIAAVVGTRRNTPYGRTVAERIGEDLASAGIPIVSGLAGGIDGITHEAALRNNGRCIAVLGTGVDAASVYPHCHQRLSENILATGGTLVSEYPPGTESMKFHFPLRNRIIAGMSRLTIVVEAANKSGSLITAFQALEQNREVFAVPGPITHAQSYGTNRLLTMGATPYVSSEEIIHLLRGKSNSIPLKPAAISETERTMLKTLGQPRHADELARILRQPAATLNAVLARLEITGLIVNQGAQIFVRTQIAEALID